MKLLLKTEELGQFLGCGIALYTIDALWWWYLLLLLGPDIGMLGYAFGPRIGAITYNLLHHKGIAWAFIAVGSVLGQTMYLSLPAILDQHIWLPIGSVLLGHASMDRMFGYGLKFGDNFHHTHLGWIGSMKRNRTNEAS
jgi:hypothetical protein